jgi:hypothetical protein
MENFPFSYLIDSIKENLRFPIPRNTLNIQQATGDSQAGIVGAAINAARQLSLF